MDTARGKPPVIGRKAVEPIMERDTESKQAVILEYTLRFRDRFLRMGKVLKEFEHQKGSHRLVRKAQVLGVFEQIDARPTPNITANIFLFRKIRTQIRERLVLRRIEG